MKLEEKLIADVTGEKYDKNVPWLNGNRENDIQQHHVHFCKLLLQ